jgi:L-threonylcarbamoyladenylate synthase
LKPAPKEHTTRILRPTDAAIAEAAAVLRAGGLVAFPTETVYGLGADARTDAAVARIYAAKARPRFNPLIAHAATTAMALREGLFSADATALAEAFWPGPLTLVVPASPQCSVSLLARAGLGSVGLRVPAHPVARALIAAAALPIAAPSANRSGRISPTQAFHVAAELDGRLPLILDGGACAVGLESTIVACLNGTIALLRPGGLSREAIEAVLGRPLAGVTGAAARPVAPGQLVSHYAPRAAVRLDAVEVTPGEGILDFAGRLARWTRPAYRDLSPSGDLAEAAARLFGALRDLDASGVAGLAVAPIPHHGLGAAINDRLRRAAAPRDA